MRTPRRAILAALALALASVTAGSSKEKPQPKGWAYVRRDSVDVHERASSKKAATAHLYRGALAQVWEIKKAGSDDWLRVEFGETTGWIPAAGVQILPQDAMPANDPVLTAMGGRYLEDIVAENTHVTRYWVGTGGGAHVLLCAVTTDLPPVELVAFRAGPTSGKLQRGPTIEYLNDPPERVEIQDLLGDGNECLITREPFSAAAGNTGENIVIRRLSGDQWQTLWKAPLSISNLASFLPHAALLQPPTKNFGAPGTVTQASVEFRARGSVREPFWKGTIELHIPGREKPVDSVNFEKLCRWDGSRFEPLD